MKRRYGAMIGLIVLVGVYCLTASVGADQLEGGLAAAQRGDYTTVLSLWKPLADQGNAANQFDLGHMYYEGLGVPQNHAEAVKWYRKAAEQGEEGTQANPGPMYFSVHGVAQDHVQSHI